MKIALCCSDILPDRSGGGIAVYTQNLASALAKRGNSVTIIGRSSSGSLKESRKGIEHVFLPRFPLPLPSKKLKLVSERLGRAVSLKQHLKKADFDIVEFPVWDAEGLFSVRSIPAKTVVRGHTPRMIVNELMIEGGFGASKVDQLFAKLEAQCARKADLFLANTHGSLEKIQTLFGLDPTKVRTCLHGVHIPEHSTDTTAEPVHVLFVGRFEPRKGIYEVFSIIPKLLERYSTLHFDFVGAGFPDDLTEWIPNPEHRARVNIHGAVDEPSLARLRNQSQIALLPSLYESFGFVHAEAMAFGTPTVAFDIPATRELIDNGSTGLLVPVKDRQALAEAVESLILNPTLRKKIGDKARDHAKTNLSLDAMAEGVEAAYQSLMSPTS